MRTEIMSTENPIDVLLLKIFFHLHITGNILQKVKENCMLSIVLRSWCLKSYGSSMDCLRNVQVRITVHLCSVYYHHKAHVVPWWRHQMETFSALLAIYAGNSPVPGEFPTQRPVTRSFDVFFDLHLNKRSSKQSWGWWLETLSRPLWRHRNGKALRCHDVITMPYFSWPKYEGMTTRKHICIASQ